MKMSAKEYYAEHQDDYFRERRKAFLELVLESLNEYMEAVDEDDGFTNPFSMSDFQEDIDVEFKFPTLDEWMTDKYSTALGDYEDHMYELQRDKEMGLD